MSAVNPISYVGRTAVDANFLASYGESRTLTVSMFTYKWWGRVPGIALFCIRTSTNNNSGLHLILTPSGQEVFPTRTVGSTNNWTLEQVAFRVDPARPYVQFIICPIVSNPSDDEVTLEGTNYAVSHVALSDVPLEGIATLVGASRTYTPDEAAANSQIPVYTPI